MSSIKIEKALIFFGDITLCHQKQNMMSGFRRILQKTMFFSILVVGIFDKDNNLKDLTKLMAGKPNPSHVRRGQLRRGGAHLSAQINYAFWGVITEGLIY